MKRFCFAVFVVTALFIHLSVSEIDPSNNLLSVRPDVVDEECLPVEDEPKICTCDLTKAECDVNCCCDQNCSEDDRRAFGMCNDRRVDADSMMCVYREVIFRSSSRCVVTVNDPSLFCVYFNNTATVDHFEHVKLVTSKEDYEPYNSRFPKFLPSRNLHVTRLAFRRYRASCLLLLSIALYEKLRVFV